MAKTLYIFSSSTLKRKDNNLVLQVRDCPVQYLPIENKNSGQVFLYQAAHWLDENKRHELAAAFVIGAIGNMIKLINYYQRRYENINANEIIEYLRYCLEKAPDTSDLLSTSGDSMFVIMVYDVNEKRVAKVLKTSRRYLFWVQNSVFEGEITPELLNSLLNSLKRDLSKIIDETEDSILFYVWYHYSYNRRDFLGVNKQSWENINIL